MSISTDSPTIYLISGQGSDARSFSHLEIDSKYPIKYIDYVLPDRGSSMESYAKLLAQQIDTTQSFILIGVSLGGMLATEMTEFLKPQKVILISSAKNKNELPRRITIQKIIPLYRFIPSKWAKVSAKFLQPLVEPDRKEEEAIFQSMLEDKNPLFFTRTIDMILSWERTQSPSNIVHIHGENDRTIPIGNVKYDYLVEGGSHMMILTRGAEISELINRILVEDK